MEKCLKRMMKLLSLDYVFKHFEMYGYSNYNEKENKYSDDIEPGTIKIISN